MNEGNEGNEGKRFEKLRILSSDYDITYHDEVRDDYDNLLDGRITETKNEIMICNKQKYNRQLQVILHEAMHGIKWEFGLNEKPSNDDETINIQLTTGVGCFLRDNPEFIREYLRVFAK